MAGVTGGRPGGHRPGRGAAIGHARRAPARPANAAALRLFGSPAGAAAGAAQRVGEPEPASHAPHQLRGVGPGHPSGGACSGRAEVPRSTGTAWVAVPNADVATPVTGTANTRCADTPRPGGPAGSRSA